MSKLKGYQCSQCGQMLPISKTRNGICTCEYCGSQYRVEDDCGRLKIETLPFRSIQLTLSKRIAYEYLKENPTETLAWSLEEMASEMAEKLMPYLEFEMEHDIKYMDYRLRGSVRIAIPQRSGLEAFEAMREKVKVEETVVGTRNLEKWR